MSQASAQALADEIEREAKAAAAETMHETLWRIERLARATVERREEYFNDPDVADECVEALAWIASAAQTALDEAKPS